MSKHTPGPWTQIGTAVYFPDVKGGFDLYGSPDAEGNARLCAAAPDLLEALEGLVEYIDRMHCIGHIQRPAQSSVAYAAIAKVKGEPI